MKKIIAILLLNFLLFSCASAKKNNHTEKYEGKTESWTEMRSENKSNSESKSQIENQTSAYEFLRNYDLFVTSNGSDYKLKFGDLEFSGNADVRVTDKKSETKKEIITKSYHWIKNYYWSRDITKSQQFWKLTTKYKTTLKHTTIDYPWYFWLILISGVTIFSIVLWEKFRLSLIHI